MPAIVFKDTRSDRFSTVSWSFVAVGAAVLIAWYAARHIMLQTALSGFTPVGMMFPTAMFTGFGSDFPNGEAEMMKSLASRAYQLLGLIGLPERTSVMVMIALEACTLLAGAAWFARRANPHLPRWTAVTAAILVSAGTIASADFARWFHPFYGSVYNFAFGAGLAAFAATLDRRLILAGLLIGITAAIHPIIALFLGLAMGFAVLADFRAYRIADMVAGAALAFLVVGLWYLFAFDGAAIAAGSVDGELFTTLTRLMSSHWHPIGLDIFGDRAWEVLLPFSALVLLFVAALAIGQDETTSTDRQIFFAIAGLFIVSLAGLWLSEVSTSPLLIKLALHRASLVILIIAAAVCVPRLIELSVSGPPVAAFAIAGLLLLPFWRAHGLPLLGTAILALIMLLGFAGPMRRGGPRALSIALGLAAILLAALAMSGNGRAISFDILATIAGVGTFGFVAAYSLMIAARLLNLPVLAAVAFAIGLSFWTPQLDAMRKPDDQALASSFLEVQQWAREHTPPGSVFMLDPLRSYGWRQYSERPSFGTMREWLYSSWIYNTDPRIMAEGIRRAGLLGIGPDDFRPASGEGVADTYSALRTKAQAAFNTMDGLRINRLASDNGISYFVFDRAKRVDLSGLDVVFENDRFAVVKPAV